jgi:hypothetical protein
MRGNEKKNELQKCNTNFVLPRISRITRIKITNIELIKLRIESRLIRELKS